MTATVRRMTHLGRALLALGALLCVTAPASAAAPHQPGDPPALCQGNLFADQIGTGAQDLLRAGNKPERLWGLGGSDVLRGSDRRATCLFGGTEADELVLGDGGGAALGDDGGDLLLGSALDDVLLGGDGDDVIRGGAGSDVITGNGGVDGIDAGPGDDHVDALDGRAEIVDCGPGDDFAATDRTDVLIGCEKNLRVGAPLQELRPSPRAAAARAIVRVRFRVPVAAPHGAYRVLLVTGAEGRACAGGPLEITHLRHVDSGQIVRVGLRPPQGGWCPGPIKAAVALFQPCRAQRVCPAAPPGRPIARIQFRAG